MSCTKSRQYLGLIFAILLITLIYVPYHNLYSRAQAAVDCNANPSDPSCSPPAATPPAVDCAANPNDPACPPVPTPPPTTPTPVPTPPPTPVPTPPPTSGCGPGTDNSTCSTTPTPTAGNNAGNIQQLSNNAGNRQESNSTGNAQQLSNSTGNATGVDFVQQILAVHNRERAAVGVPPLVWNDTLAAGAKTWADHLVAIGEMSHSQNGEGENIAAEGRDVRYPVGTTPVPIAHMVGTWVDEKNRHQAVATGDSMAAGHYLQLTSRLAKGVGCGVASGGPQNWDLLVCRYSPPGWDNWVINQAKGPTSQESNNTGNGP